MKTNIFHSSTPPFQSPTPRPSSCVRQTPRCHKAAPWILALVLLFAFLLPAALQAQFIYTTNNSTINIQFYTGWDLDLTIPATIDGLPVTTIHTYAFYGRSNLTSVTFPNTITNIADGLFSICAELTAITVDALNLVYSSSNGVLFDKNQTTLIRFPRVKSGNYIAPTTVTSIWGAAFDQSPGLTSVTLPNCITKIGDWAFNECRNLTNIGAVPKLTTLGIGAFSGCRSLSSFTIPSTLTSIESYTFSDCWSLPNVTIPNSVTNIGESAFIFSGLTNITIGTGLATIGNWTFSYCSLLTGLYFNGNTPDAGLNIFHASNPVIYYLPGTTGWSSSFGGRPTAVWFLPNPIILTSGVSFGVRTNRFGFIISWATNASVVVQACTNLANPAWLPVSTNTLIGGSSYFSDAEWTNYPARFYRLRSP